MGQVLGDHWDTEEFPLYQTDSISRYGPIRYRGAPETIGVLGTVGVATLVGSDGAGNALWRVVVHDAELPGLWILASGKFWPHGPPPPPVI
jgi:hypothetical protein